MKKRVAELAAIAMACAAPWSTAGEGLVAHWDFSEGQGDVLHDRTGNGNHGKIQGAEWVKCGDGQALCFDGKDDYVDCGAGPSLNLTEALTIEVALRPHAVPPSGVEPGVAGKGVERSYGVTYFRNGKCYWYLRPAMQDCSAYARPGIWHHVVGTFDGTASKLYVDGELRRTGRVLAKAKLKAPGSFYIGGGFGWGEPKPYSFNGTIAEVRVYDRALSDAEVRGGCERVRRRVGHDLSVKPFVSCFTGEVIAVIDRGFGSLPPEATVTLESAQRGATKPIRRTRIEAIADAPMMETSIDAADLPAAEYELRAFLTDRRGKALASAAATFVWPDRPTPANGSPLNNMVVELLKVTRPRRLEEQYDFVTPHDSWVFFSSTVQLDQAGKLSLLLGRESSPILVHQGTGERTVEAMRFLRAGAHRLVCRATGRATLRGLVVRAIPEIAYCFLPVTVHLDAFGSYDRAFLAEDVLPNVNCMVSQSYSQFPKTEEFQAFVRQWREAGRKWIVRRGGVPGLHVHKDKPLTVDGAFEFWAAEPAWRDPLLDGIIVDEFGSGADERCTIWRDAVNRLHRTFPGKSFYPYCGGLCDGEPGRAFVRDLVKAGDRCAFERYLREQPTQAHARQFLDTMLIEAMRAWRQVPGAERNLLICFGHWLSAPPETVSVDPAVDFKVYMDMQFNILANDPAFRGLGGVMEYHAGFADEEYVRWAGKLFRHYCIEGNAEMLSAKYGYRYNPRHITNPDFDRGSHGWALSPATPNSISVKHFAGLGWMQGRYPRGQEGDHFLVTQRSAVRPNVFSQAIVGLRPGRTYSLKMITGDYDDLAAGKSDPKKLALSIRIDGAELVEDKCFQHVFQQWPGHYATPFTRKNRFAMNLHRLVFRAQRARATLEISDWVAKETPGGPPGQSIAHNYIEVQPYLSAEE